MKGVLLAALVAVVASVTLAGTASAEPQPGVKKKGFRLFARALGAMTVNRIYCGLASDGRICVDSTNSSTIGGGFWPKGTADQYIFNTGLQLAGVISNPGGAWDNDTTGAFFFDPKGTTEHGEEVQPIYNLQNLDDKAIWPDAACVPNDNEAGASIYNALLRSPVGGCAKSASQGDVWWVSWEGNPTLKAGRSHPLGVAVETRGLGWNFPAGNNDIYYFVYTFYNISTTDSTAYGNVRPSLAHILLDAARSYQTQVAASGTTLPTNGYTLTSMFAAFATDMDVAEAGSNYASVNLPFALGYTYDHSFSQPPAWTFDPRIFSAPFFQGSGFAGVKYLKSPTGPGAIQLYSNTINGGVFNDPRDVKQLYRYLSGTVSPAAGDQPCNTGDPVQTHICYINNTSPNDMRFFQSSTPLTIGPGQSGSIVVAYIFAAPVATGGCGAICDVKPGDPRVLSSPGTLATVGANTIDSLTGYAGFTTDANGNGLADQSEFKKPVAGSLLDKSLIAQSVFDNQFLLPFAPEPPDFFLIPGDNQVTVLWRPTISETTGDPFFTVAQQPRVLRNLFLGDTVTVPNALYDPNYRQSDIEGYRIYRGRVDNPGELQLLAQFDYSGTVIEDFAGQVNPTDQCAPELGLRTTPGCPVNFDPVLSGVGRAASTSYDIVGNLVQLQFGKRALLANGKVIITGADTAVTGGATSGPCAPSACPALSNTGVPFTYLDKTPRNNFRYFYSVTAFDVNSFQSAPSSLESPRVTKSASPVHAASNYVSSADVALHVVGRGGIAMDTVIKTDPTIDQTKGTFSGPSRPANGLQAAFVGELATKVLNGQGGFQLTLDSISPTGEGDESACCGGVAIGSPTTYYFTAQSGALVSKLEVPVQMDGNDGGAITGGQAFFSATNVDPSLSQRYGGNSSYELKGTAADSFPSFYLTNAQTLGCRIKGGNIPGGNECIYNGLRWFDSPSTPSSSHVPSAREGTEAFADPTSGNCNFNGGNSPVCAAVSFNNAGAVTGVTTIHNPQSYTQLIRRWRNMESSMAPYYRAADINVYWGAAGRIDSVIDLTHNVVVPDAFVRNGAGAVVGVRPLGANWSVIDQAKTNAAGSSDTRPTVLTANDLGCYEPFRSIHTSPGLQYPCTAATPYAVGQPFTPDTIVVPGAVAFYKDAQANAATAAVAAGAGFALYVTGTFTEFELTGGALPAAGTVWTLRTYAGMVRGGQGVGGGSTGLPYTFDQALRPFTVVGASSQLAFNVTNVVSSATGSDLKKVHTVPDPYYVTSEFEQATDNKVIKFVNLPRSAIIRIYSSSGILVQILEHNSTTFGGEETWNVRNRNNQVVASGVYFYHIEASDGKGNARRVGRMTIVNFAQ
jgi:hypothetical protein